MPSDIWESFIVAGTIITELLAKTRTYFNVTSTIICTHEWKKSKYMENSHLQNVVNHNISHSHLN